MQAVKGRIAMTLNKLNIVKREEPLQAADIRLSLKNRPLEDTATCHDQQVVNDCCLYLLLKRPGMNEWEDLDEVSGQHFEYEYPTKPKEEKPEESP